MLFHHENTFNTKISYTKLSFVSLWFLKRYLTYLERYNECILCCVVIELKNFQSGMKYF
jgi:hypothetical protein